MISQESWLQPLHVLNLSEHIEEQILKAILNGVFRPGDRLVETSIAEQLEVSRAPVREALAGLEREGIVVNTPRKGYSVVDFTDKDIDEIYSLRLLLELGALKRAMPRLTEKDVTAMQSVLDKLGELARRGPRPEEIVALDMSFHELICRAADHNRLFSVWNSMRLQTEILVSLTVTTHYDHPEQPRELHQTILDALCERGEKGLKSAEVRLIDHIQDAEQRARRALKVLRSSKRAVVA